MLEGPEGQPVLHFAQGMVAPGLSAETRRAPGRIHQEETPAGRLLYGVRERGKPRVLEISLGNANFYVPLRQTTDLEKALAIARTYRSGNGGAGDR